MSTFSSFKECFTASAQQISAKERIGRILDIHHFEVKGDLTLIRQNIETTLEKYVKEGVRLKINLAFGYILKGLDKDSYRFFHPSQNHAFFIQPRVIVGPDDITLLLKNLTNDNILEHVYKTKLASNWTVLSVVCFAMRIYKIHDVI